ncbi:helix-turn-helix domain-containing protein [Tepidibacter hydrothermalis]|uniref:Helix-turn-helix domain-containing protein n=1 Tax=Tepidibacter hydrothermalis TaxID=3036126 RepID=A0ABY8EHE9_9FIRM|nr:helix-turn-helix domain-containing protein [Tepidibacter hydrothermalis]
MSVKNNLKSIRMREYMIDNQKEFAKLLGVNYRQYNRYETEGVVPSLEIALKIASKLNKKVEDVFYLCE